MGTWVSGGFLYRIPLTVTVFLFSSVAVQSEELQEGQQRGQAARLAEIEVLLHTLTAKTQVGTAASQPPHQEQGCVL